MNGEDWEPTPPIYKRRAAQVPDQFLRQPSACGTLQVRKYESVPPASASSDLAQSWAAPFFARLMTKEMAGARQARMALRPTHRTGAACHGTASMNDLSKFKSSSFHLVNRAVAMAYGPPGASRPAAPFVVVAEPRRCRGTEGEWVASLSQVNSDW